MRNTFTTGVGGGGDCGDLDAPNGLSNVTWYYDWGHVNNGFAQCNGTTPKSAEVSTRTCNTIFFPSTVTTAS